MVTDLDFEEIDGLMIEMEDTKNLADAIAADVAKISPDRKQTKAQKKTVKKSIMAAGPDPKPVTGHKADKPTTKTKNNEPNSSSKASPSESIRTRSKDTKPESALDEDIDGTKVAVRILTKYVEDPEEPVFRPNPRTGKYMDMVSPRNDMTAHREQETILVPVATVIKTEETIITTAEEDTEEILVDGQGDRERLERNGLDPDATVEEMMEYTEPEDGDDFLEGLMKNLGDDIENLDSDENIEEEVTADIVSFPDRSDAFLTELEIEKRPLGGSAIAASGLLDNDKKIDTNEISADDRLDKKPSSYDNLSKKEQKKLAKKAEKQAKKQDFVTPNTKKKGRTGQALLYIALLLLLAIFGGTLGALAYFSGLF